MKCKLYLGRLPQFANLVSRGRDPSGQHQREFDAGSGNEVNNSMPKRKTKESPL